jgi:Fe2+ transport system protein FeoA
LARMMAWGITLNSSIKILRKGPFQGPMQVQLGRINLMMPSTLVATLEVIQS